MKQEPLQEMFQWPCLRRDLEFSRATDTQDGTTTVKDAANDRFYRFGEVECFILQHLDGTTALSDIQDRAKEQFGADLDRETLDAFIHSLRQRGLLETPVLCEAETAPRALWRNRIRGNWLYLRFKILDPDCVLDRMVGRFRFCFTRGFVFGTAGLTLFTTLIFLANLEEFSRDFQRVFIPETIVPALIIVLATTICHEFAHGLTCKHYGGRVREMGFLLLFFQPALYCNVSDAWLFPKKTERMWVGLAGTYLEMVLWALAVIVWRATAPETALNFVALVLMGTSGIRLFLNLNPLIKLDGYYVLSDWLGIPNLRARAFSFIRVWIRRPWLWSQISLPARDKRVYLWYGLLGVAFTIWILGFILTTVAGFLVEELQGIGFLLFIGLLAMILNKPIISFCAKIMRDNTWRMERPS